MNKPLFKIGEEVILQSVEYPECNGEYVVEGVVHGKEYTYMGVNVVCSDEGYGYDLGFIHVGDIEDGYTFSVWCESALRKKHYPSSQSYDKLMASLKQPQKVSNDLSKLPEWLPSSKSV